MLLRMIALSAVGYAGYRYLSSNRAIKRKPSESSEVRIAGGPLSSSAFLVHADDDLLKA